ncbi:MAG: hypothetical protein OXC61_11205 [Flavobacteriaceae bacterium]|nr:hypothetical protein [Flavobacteriaceae bacterium]
MMSTNQQMIHYHANSSATWHSLKLFLFLSIMIFGHPQKGASQVHEIGLFIGITGLSLAEQASTNSFKERFMSNLDERATSIGYIGGFQYRYNLNNYFSFHASVLSVNFSKPPRYNKVQVNNPEMEDNVPPIELKGPEQSFELNARLEYWLLSRSLIYWDIPQLRPYIFGGGGALLKAPGALNIKDVIDARGKWNNKNFLIISSVGVGLTINPTNWLNIGLEFATRFVPSYKLKFNRKEDFELYSIVDDRVLKVDGNDWYYVFGVSTTISLQDFPLVN